MKTFSQFLLIKEADLDGTPPADMRVNRPAKYSIEQQMELIQKLQNPKNKELIAKVLADHPEMASELEGMIKDALMRHSNIDYYRMSPQTFDDISNSAQAKSSSMVNDIK